LNAALGALAAVTIQQPTGTVSGTSVQFQATTADMAHTTQMVLRHAVLIGSSTTAWAVWAMSPWSPGTAPKFRHRAGRLLNRHRRQRTERSVQIRRGEDVGVVERRRLPRREIAQREGEPPRHQR